MKTTTARFNPRIHYAERWEKDQTTKIVMQVDRGLTSGKLDFYEITVGQGLVLVEELMRLINVRMRQIAEGK